VARNNLDERLSGSGWPERRKVLEDWLRAEPGARKRRLRQIVDDTWNAPAVQRLQYECLEAVAKTQRSIVMADSGIASAEAFRPLLNWAAMREAVRKRDPFLGHAIRALPVMALEARTLTIGFADRAGHIEIPEQGTLQEGVERLKQDRRTMIAGAVVLLGGADVAVDGDLDSPRVIANAFNNLLRGGTTAGGAAAGTAGAAGPALLVAAAALAAGVTIQAANRAIKRRDDLAHALLTAQRVEAAEHIYASTGEVLRVAREILAARLRHLLEIDDAKIQQLSLKLAIADAEHARGRMLEAVDADYLV
jgi:hypothetical protein